jgi:hypothetical protein
MMFTYNVGCVFAALIAGGSCTLVAASACLSRRRDQARDSGLRISSASGWPTVILIPMIR